ncbi:MAG: hypothetical protein Q9170_002442 [Blastenia crenularia]
MRPDAKDDLPSALQVGQDSTKQWAHDIPDSLKAAPSDLTPRSSIDSQRSHDLTYSSVPDPHLQSTNPFNRMGHADSNAQKPIAIKSDGSTAIWADQSPGAPTDPFGQQNHGVIEPSMLPTTDSPSRQPPSANPWTGYMSPNEETLPPTNGAPRLDCDTHEHKDQWHQEQGHTHNVHPHPIPAPDVSYAEELRELVAQPFQSPSEDLHQPNSTENSFFPVHNDPNSPNTQQIRSHQPKNEPTVGPEIPPPQPPKLQSQELQTFSQQRHLPEAAESQQAKIREQRNQTYQIRHINWFDASATVNPRRSPIIVQNANGPCPLLALVNALVLSTPATINTGLIETLRVREQVSLGLLLDAVIDELMSGRRSDPAQNLPDVSDLYAFLINLHTGMNVNPRFVEPVSTSGHLLDGPNDQSPAGLSDARRAGGFEETPFMRLYSTFSISLIHGWLPRRNHPVCAALNRSATTYEDAQSLLFAEEDLETKLQSQGLNTDEQRLLEDISSVKHFLATSPTQLTDYGLDVITETLLPGAIAILFRNDHFSTLYKQPRSGQIFTLVTDLGYAGHDEVVWESLVDISGEGSEFFSGDFRPVGNNVANNRQSAGPGSAVEDMGWTTVSRSSANNRTQRVVPPNSSHGQFEPSPVTNAFSKLSVADNQDADTSVNTEQEDHDLALAMQLQEEEEDRERQEVAARQRREDELSQAYLDSASRSPQRGGRPQVPPRGGGARRVPPRKETTSDDAPPPTYEQAAKRPVYDPPANGSRHTQVPLRTNVDTTGVRASRPVRQTSAYSQTNAAFAGAGRPGPAMRRQQAAKKEEKDCVVM